MRKIYSVERVTRPSVCTACKTRFDAIAWGYRDWYALPCGHYRAASTIAKSTLTGPEIAIALLMVE